MNELSSPTVIIPINPSPVIKDEAKYEPVPIGTGRAKVFDGLTAKQENYCRYVANGLTGVSAYRQAFGVSDDAMPETVYNRSAALMRKPEVKQRIDHLLIEKEQIAVNDYAVIRRFVIERLQLEALDEDNNGGTRVRALELLGKMDKVQLFSDKPQKDEKPTSKRDITKELEQRLTKILASRTLDLSAKPS